MVKGTSSYATAMNAAGITYVAPACDNALVALIDEAAALNHEKRNAWAKRALITAVNAAGLKNPDGSPKVYVTPEDNAIAVANAAAKQAQEALAKAQAELEALRAQVAKLPGELTTNGVNRVQV